MPAPCRRASMPLRLRRGRAMQPATILAALLGARRLAAALTVAANWHTLEGLTELDPATREPYAALAAELRALDPETPFARCEAALVSPHELRVEARDALLASGMEGGMTQGYEKLDALLARG